MTREEIKNDNYISLSEAATNYTEHSQEYLSLRARQGKLKAVKIGRNWLTKKEWIDEYKARVNRNEQELGNEPAPIKAVLKLPWSEKVFHSLETVLQNFAFVLRAKKIPFNFLFSWISLGLSLC